ncbi:AAA family ATPase [Natrialba hulunbeirensis JCM 10989]|uniref:AAA family ATPase n=1 Tax=Natrialba hulunbeirensis JCM 10989 TaxID=1227493 RepID=L9ZZH6_9EURY|nr:AAA family ATPase [Natrialba hulunbeirensis]ELY91759.1 AAA family ATPase [Natrialba hulunbeirensis JCM 10989]
MYDHFADRLQAEFDRLLFALESIITHGIETDDSSFELVAERSNESLSTPGFELQSLGSKIRALNGETEHSDDDERGLAIGEADRTDLEAYTAELESNIQQAREQGVDLRLDRLVSAFDLSRTHLDAFLLALGPVLDRSVSVAYGRIRGTGQPQLPTVDLLEDLLVVLHGSTDNDDSEPPGEVLASPSPLFEYGLLERQHRSENVSPVYDTVTVDERIVQYLKGDDSLDPILSERVSIEHHNRTLSDLVFDDETTATLEAIEQRTNATDVPSIYYFSGEDGTGKNSLPGAFSDPETPVLRADATVLEDTDLTTRLIREAALQEATIHLEGLESVTGDEEGPTIDEEDGTLGITTAEDRPSVDTIVERLDDAPGDVFLSHTDEWKPDIDLEAHGVETAHCLFPEYDTRLAIWEEYRTEFAEDSLLENVATNFRLPQRDIRRAIKTARYLCRTDGDADDIDPAALEASSEPDSSVFAPVNGALERDHLYEACKRYSASNLEALAESMEPGYTFEDIYLNDRPKTHLRELCGHLQYRGQVTSEWGFGETGDRGDGVVALFYGPPGTGKTMAAEIIATETGLDLYRVDLSQIVNKYIGETESRLGALLEEAERSNAILLFDEADSLFGERTDVGDSTDRYANNVTNFLLQRLESFDGIALLTTNKRSGIDPAFKRRIAHSINFDVPQERVRRQIWRNVFPDEASVDTSEFDYEYLGRIVVTPAIVRKVAKYAAYIAATEAHDGHPLEDSPTDFADVTITFDHVILALQYASEAGGVAIEQDFTQYEDKLRSYENQNVSREWRDELSRKYGDETNTDPSETDSSGDETGRVVEDESPVDEDHTSAPPVDADGGETVDPGSDSDVDPDTGPPESTANTPSGKRPASSVDPADGRSPEAVVTEFVTRLADGDGSAHAFYHSRTIADEFTSKDLAVLDHGNVSIGNDIERVTDAHDSVVLRVDHEVNTEQIPESIVRIPETATYELRPEEGEGWRIFSIAGR